MRSTFIGTSAFIGRIDGPTRCAFWAEEPTAHGFDRSRLIEVDLSRTPQAAAARQISWDAVEVEDCLIGPGGKLGGTTIGPRWPELQVCGMVYLEEGLWRRLPPSLRFARPPREAKARDYEFMRVVYWPHIDDGRAGRRYAGFHAELLELRGTLAHLVIFPPGSSQDDGVRGNAAWIDLSDPEQCDAGPDGYSTIATAGAPRAGALFLAIAEPIGVSEPKLPVFKSATDAPKFPPYVAEVMGPKIPPFVGLGGGKLPIGLGRP